MAGSPKEKLEVKPTTEETTDETREVYLKDGRTLVVSDAGSDQLVEIRNESGMLELRITLTEQGPVLQMESVRLQLKASEAVEIESPQVAITGTEKLELAGGKIEVDAEEEIEIEGKKDVRVKGKMIWLN
jgi:hypothetical protein